MRADPLGVAVPVLETERLRLRAHRADDYDAYVAMWAEPTVIRHIGDGKPLPAEQAWRRLLHNAGLWVVLGYGYWAVEEKDSGRFVGDVGFADFRREIQPSMNGMLEFGWILAAHAHGKGYASEAVAAASAWAQAHLPGMREVCIIAPDNLGSIRVAEKAGFQLSQQTTYHGSPTLFFSR